MCPCRALLQVLGWLVRVFFACTIGFEVPIRDLWTKDIIYRAALFLLAGVGKLATGALAMPRTLRNSAMVGWAMAAWGEFAFIVATASREMGSMDDTTYGAVLLAVLLSAFYAPIGVKMSLGTKGNSGFAGRSLKDILSSVFERSRSDKVMHSVYYKTSLIVKSRWGLMDILTKALNTKLNVEILDFYVSIEGSYTHFQFYLKDRTLKAPGIEHDCPENEAAEARCHELRSSLASLLDISTSHGEEDSNDVHQEKKDKEQQCDATILYGHVQEHILLERWEPSELNDSAPDNDDELAFEEAHRGLAKKGAPAAAAGRPASVRAAWGEEKPMPGKVSSFRAAPARSSLSITRHGSGFDGQGPLFKEDNMTGFYGSEIIEQGGGRRRSASFDGARGAGGGGGRRRSASLDLVRAGGHQAKLSSQHSSRTLKTVQSGHLLAEGEDVA